MLISSKIQVGNPNQFLFRGDLLNSPTAPPGGAGDTPGNDAAETTQNPGGDPSGATNPKAYHNEVGQVMGKMF